jgi:hypothetical protein
MTEEKTEDVISGFCQAIILHEPRIIYGNSLSFTAQNQYEKCPVAIDGIWFRIESDSFIRFNLAYHEKGNPLQINMWHAGSFTVEGIPKRTTPTPIKR